MGEARTRPHGATSSHLGMTSGLSNSVPRGGYCESENATKTLDNQMRFL